MPPNTPCVLVTPPVADHGDLRVGCMEANVPHNDAPSSVCRDVDTVPARTLSHDGAAPAQDVASPHPFSPARQRQTVQPMCAQQQLPVSVPDSGKFDDGSECSLSSVDSPLSALRQGTCASPSDDERVSQADAAETELSVRDSTDTVNDAVTYDADA